jgi:hypothetical protein
MAKNLPIKLFRKRANDKLLNNIPGGSADGRRFKLSGLALTRRVNYFHRYLDTVNADLKRKVLEQNYLPTVVKMRVNGEALAKSYRSHIGKVLNIGRKTNIIGLIGDDELLVKIDDSTDLETIDAKFSQTEKNLIGISAIERAENFKPMVSLPKSGVKEFKVKLINYGDDRLNQIAERYFQEICGEQGAQCEKLNYTRDLILYRVSAIKPQTLSNFSESEGVFSITEMPIIRLDKAAIGTGGKIDVKKPEPGVDYFRIGVFDEGIAGIAHLKEWMGGSYVAFGVDEYDNEHGTFLGGIINYGDELQGKAWTGTRPLKIYEAVIFPNDKFGYIDEPMMIGFMREAISKFPEVKVWNFSIGNDVPVDDGQYSDFAKFLDELQDTNNILIIKAAGNCSNFVKAAPKGRITQASESVRTLVVGSLAHEKSATDQADINHPSPFSMVGPGVADVIKPDLVHYGGNAGVVKGSVVSSGVKSFSPSGKIASAVGTSYSAPRIAAMAADLAGSINTEFNPLLIKALLVHSASHPEEYEDDFDERVKQIGFGLPVKIDDILHNDPDEATLILADYLDKGTYIKIMDFPYPKSLVYQGLYYGQVTITLVTQPFIDPYQGVEYIQDDIDISFGTFAEKVKVVGSKINRNPIDTKDTFNLLRSGIYSSVKQRAATAAFKSERFLKNYKDGYRDQFVPVKKWCFDLEELRETAKNEKLNSSRNWYLTLEGSYRNNYELRMKDSDESRQKFVLIATIRDTRRKGKAYNEVAQLLSRLNFVHEDIKLNQHVQVK